MHLMCSAFYMDTYTGKTERESANDNVCERRIFTDKKCNYTNDVVGTVILVVVDDYINDKKPRK